MLLLTENSTKCFGISIFSEFEEIGKEDKNILPMPYSLEAIYNLKESAVLCSRKKLYRTRGVKA